VTEIEAGKLLALAASLFPSHQVARETGHAWALALANEDYGSCRAAAIEVAKRSRFFPAIAEILAEASEIRRAAREANADLQLGPGAKHGSELHHKGRMQITTLRAWFEGLIDTPAMMRESAHIYAEERPFPGDGPQVVDAAEAAIEQLRGKSGPLAPVARRVADQVTRPEDDWGGGVRPSA